MITKDFPSYENEYNTNLCLAEKSFDFGECLMLCDFDLCDERCITEFKADFANCPCQVSE